MLLFIFAFITNKIISFNIFLVEKNKQKYGTNVKVGG